MAARIDVETFKKIKKIDGEMTKLPLTYFLLVELGFFWESLFEIGVFLFRGNGDLGFVKLVF